MADTIPKATGEHDQPDGTLDRALDAALAQYSSVEPRARLEERILANLRAEQVHATGRAWWHWGFAVAVVAIVIVAGLTWRPSRAPHSVVANHLPVTIPRPSTQETKMAPHAAAEVAAARRTLLRRPAATRRAPAVRTIAGYPKLDHFPSPQPLSAEEVALARYVRNFPKEAQLVAQAEEEFEFETQKEMNQVGSETWPSSSIQQER